MKQGKYPPAFALYEYRVSPEHIRFIRAALDEGDYALARELVSGLHPADIADIIEQFPAGERESFIQALRPNFDPEILVELDEYVREEVIKFLSTDELTAAILELPSDDAVTIYDDLDKEKQSQILEKIPEDERQTLEISMDYPESSAGRLMQREITTIPFTWDIQQVIDYFKLVKEIAEDLNQIYIVDDQLRPIGVISLVTLLQSPTDKPVEEVMQRELITVPVTMDQDDVAYYFHQYNLMSVPVIGDNGEIVGMITSNQIIHVIQEEATEDFMLLGRVSDTTLNKPVIELSLSRLRWLIVTFINTLLASSVISHFEVVIEKIVALAVLMPIVASMGGNSGMQVVTVTVRALAQRDLREGLITRTILKEVSISFINSLILAILLSSITIFWYNDTILGVILGTALVFNMLWSALAGTVFPLLLDKLGFDPAIGAGPLLTTTTDVLGFSAFLGLAKIFLF